MKYKYIIFDLFGTLVSDEEVVGKGKILKEKLTEAENTIFVAHWRDWHRNNYSTNEFIIRLKETDIYSNEKLLFINERISLSSLVSYEDTIPTLKLLKDKGYNLALLSNSPPSPKHLFENKKVFTDLFDKSFWSFEMGCMKPDKLIFEIVVKDLNCQKSEVLYVGDSYENDYLGAKNAGVDAFLIDRLNKYNLKNSIKLLSDLLNLL